MSLLSLLFAYVFGGLTFIPLLIAAVVLPGWLLLPIVPKAARAHEDDKSTSVLANAYGETAAKGLLKAAQEEKYAPDGAASATFAVLRAFSFQAANEALIAREKSNATVGSANGAVDGVADVRDGGSESVYQSMYRSVFDRSKRANGAPSVLENKDGTSTGGDGVSTARVKRKVIPANVFYIVLRHGHLMLYDSPVQMEVKHVISLAHHTISLSEGGPDDEEIMDADLFIKRTAIVLTPIALENGRQQTPSAQPKPFYLFSANCSEKEDFYHALLSTRGSPPIPQPLIPEDAIKLQSTLHSTSLTPETRAFNALVSRIFLAIHRTSSLENLIRNKIEKKIARVQKPSFLTSLAVQSIDLGDAAPIFSNPRLKDLHISGDLTLAFDLRYNGGVRVGIAAVAKLDLGQRFKARSVDLVLATSLQRMTGHMLVRVKPPPSNRIWFCFDGMPEMDIKVEPIVSTRQITYTFILRQIEERIRSVVAETLVKPHWDDAPFFDTRNQRVRGGIWSDEGAEDNIPLHTTKNSSAATTPTIADTFAGKNEKTMSMPTLPTPTADGESSGSDTALKAAAIASGSHRDEALENLKRRSVASLPLPPPSTTSTEQHPAKPMRSPSLTSPTPSTPSVAIHQPEVAPVRADDAYLQPPTRGTWRSRSLREPPQSRRDAVEAVREMRDRTLQTSGRQGASGDEAEQPSPAIIGEEENAMNMDLDATSLLEDDASDMPGGHDTMHSAHHSPQRTDSERSIATTSSSNSTTPAQRRQQQRKNLLAATAAATSAARNWSWNAIANRKGGPNAAQPQAASGQPIGRGQPLPPPGTPLPGPQKPGIFATAGLVGGGSLKRKPVKPALPPRPSVAVPENRQLDVGVQRSEREGGDDSVVHDGATLDADDEGHSGGEQVDEGEFGPWNENSGLGSEPEMCDLPDARHEQGIDNSGQLPFGPESQEPVAPRQQETSQTAKVPPPLPARRRSAAASGAMRTISKAGEDPRDSAEATMPALAESEGARVDNGRASAAYLQGDTENIIPGVRTNSETDEKFMMGEEVSEADYAHNHPDTTPAIDGSPAEEAGGHTAHYGDRPESADSESTDDSEQESFPHHVDIPASAESRDGFEHNEARVYGPDDGGAD